MRAEEVLAAASARAGGDLECWLRHVCVGVSELPDEELARFAFFLWRERRSLPTATPVHPSRPAAPSNAVPDDAYGRALSCMEQRGERATPRAQLSVYEAMRALPQGSPHRRFWWLREAAERGEPLAQFEMAEQILRNFSAPPEELKPFNSPAEFRKLLISAAAAGVPRAQLQLADFYLGRMHSIWRNTDVDVSAAIAYYRFAAEQRDDPQVVVAASTELGDLYYSGLHVPRDYAEAYRWYSRLNVAQARPCGPLWLVRARLIRMYDEGLGTPRDADKAQQLRRFHRACI